MNPNLDSVIDGKIKPLLQAYQQKYLGLRVADIEQDISDQLKNSTLLDIAVDVALPYKQAKKAFKRAYLLRLLQLHLGNISTAATAAGVDRRSVHRLVGTLRLPNASFRENAQPAYVRKNAVQTIVEDVVESYRGALNSSKYKAFYAHSEALSADIVKELPESHLTLKEAEKAFERKYLGQLLASGLSIAEAARKAKMRYEVLHRKLKVLGITGQKQ
jgi:DNA-binding NtrC family response regulator